MKFLRSSEPAGELLLSSPRHADQAQRHESARELAGIRDAELYRKAMSEMKEMGMSGDAGDGTWARFRTLPCRSRYRRTENLAIPRAEPGYEDDSDSRRQCLRGISSALILQAEQRSFSEFSGGSGPWHDIGWVGFLILLPEAGIEIHAHDNAPLRPTGRSFGKVVSMGWKPGQTYLFGSPQSPSSFPPVLLGSLLKGRGGRTGLRQSDRFLVRG